MFCYAQQDGVWDARRERDTAPQWRSVAASPARSGIVQMQWIGHSKAEPAEWLSGRYAAHF